MRQPMKKGFRIHESDNVTTLLADAVKEDIEVIGASLDRPICCCEPVSFGHKIAVFDIAENADVVKYGVVIGTATQPIHAGQWVHLHNCRSRLDERSATLDLHTGSSQDVKYE
jgi:altronate dehydratase small subunit